MENQAVLLGVAARHGISAVLLDALIWHESKWNIKAVGDDGLAIGLGQMHPTACLAIGADPKSRGRSIADDLDLAAGYLKLMLDHMGGDTTLALMAYNQGPTVIGRGKAYADAVDAGMMPNE